MKIYTITCSNAYNYGAVLQAYALQKYLESKGHDVKIIDYHPPYLRKISDKYKNRPLIKVVRKILYAPDYSKSKKVFNYFKKAYLKLSEACYSLDDIKKISKADLYIAGSDQIWNPYMKNGLDENYYLDIDGINKISYAASIGRENIDEEFFSVYKKYLPMFSHITVREKCSAEFLNDIGINAEYVVDPVYLLDREQWLELSKKRYKEKYIVVYALHHIQAIYEYARKLSNKLGVKMYVINVEIREIRRGNDKFFWNPSVNEFLSLIENSEAVVSNSFHGISFGLIFRKAVHIFDTEKDDIRLKNIIELYDLKNRVIEQTKLEVMNNDIEEKTQELIEKEIARSKMILDGMLVKGDKDVKNIDVMAKY